MEKISAHVIIHGRVQGVYFRAYTRDEARLLGLAGWVRNCRDGKVEAYFEGEKSRVEKMVAWCHRGSPGARVERVEVQLGDFKGQEAGFEVRYR